MLQIGIMLHSLVIGLTLSVSVGSEFSKPMPLVVSPGNANIDCRHSFPCHCDPLPSTIRRSFVRHPNSWPAIPSQRSWYVVVFPLFATSPSADLIHAATRLSRCLKPCLAITFALTTPLGIWIGLGVFGSTKPPAPGTDPHSPLTQTQSLLSALSAGMLIYAACVEMLAGDFVMDPTMWRSSLRRQVMALVAVAVGVASMGMVG